MDGVIILSSYECGGYRPGTVFAFLIAIAMIAFMMFFRYGMTGRKIIFTIYICAIIVFIGFCTSIIYNQINKKWYEYSVILSDNVSFNDFVRRYEIVSVDGSILRVRER